MQSESASNAVEPFKGSAKLDKRRPYLYALLLIFQVLSLISNIVLIPASKDSTTILSFPNAMLIDFVIVILLASVNMVFLYNFIRIKWVFWLMLVLLAISILLNFVNVIFKLQELHFPTFLVLFGITTFISITVIFFSFLVAIRDIFGNITVKESLLGATNLFLLIGSGFAFVYAFMNILMPGSMVPNAEISSLYNTCVIYSSHVLAGVDLPSNNFQPAIRNAMVFESVFGHLYAVFIVGRLLSK